ncbi:MAG: hypothetical protein ACJ744_15755 [Gaiellaceae bacterium]|jgi:hypothetical protein
MNGSDRIARIRASLRRKPIYYALSTAVLVGGAALLTVVNAPEWLFLTFIVGLWAGLMYLLRWRKG